jgi:hypothetical protein
VRFELNEDFLNDGMGTKQKFCLNKPSATVLLEFYEFCSLKEKGEKKKKLVLILCCFFLSRVLMETKMGVEKILISLRLASGNILKLLQLVFIS